MTYVYRPENKGMQLLYRWHPKRKCYQFWDVVSASWIDSQTYRDRPFDSGSAALADYQDTWCEAEGD
jgi:hypothetical protein